MVTNLPKLSYIGSLFMSNFINLINIKLINLPELLKIENYFVANCD